MKCIPEATLIDLSKEERAELEGLVRSRKTEHRLRQRARIVLLAADGLASRVDAEGDRLHQIAAEIPHEDDAVAEHDPAEAARVRENSQLVASLFTQSDSSVGAARPR